MEYVLLALAIYFGMGVAVAIVRLIMKPMSKRETELMDNPNVQNLMMWPFWWRWCMMAAIIALLWPVELMRRR